jgi:hypothetical protein
MLRADCDPCSSKTRFCCCAKYVEPKWLFGFFRPRWFCCGLHWWNNSHESPQCRVMMADEETYPESLRVATTHVGTGGNPKVGPPVSFNRPPPFSFMPSTLSSSISPLVSLSLTSSVRAHASHPYEDTSMPASPALPSLKSERLNPRRIHALAASPTPLSSSVLCSSPLSRRPSVSWSLPLATVSVFSSSSSVVRTDKARQAEIKRQDKTRPTGHDLTQTRFSPPLSSHALPDPMPSLALLTRLTLTLTQTMCLSLNLSPPPPTKIRLNKTIKTIPNISPVVSLPCPESSLLPPDPSPFEALTTPTSSPVFHVHFDSSAGLPVSNPLLFFFR